MRARPTCPPPTATCLLLHMTTGSRYLFSNSGFLGPTLLNYICPFLYLLLSEMKIGPFLPLQSLAPFQSFLIVFPSAPPQPNGATIAPFPLPPLSLPPSACPAPAEPAAKSCLLSKSQFLPNNFTSTGKPGPRQLLLLALFCASSK